MLSASILKSFFEFRTWIPNVGSTYLKSIEFLDSELLGEISSFLTVIDGGGG